MFSLSSSTLLVLCELVWGSAALLVADDYGSSGQHYGRQFGPPTPEYSLRARQSQWTIGQTVDTDSGPVAGHGASNLGDVSEYLGIPYAQPPVGDLRFQPPVKYTGTAAINASAFGPSCFASQVPAGDFNPDDYANMSITPTAVDLMRLMYETTAVQSEDCLTLNIWTKPQAGEARRAVLVWIHGGGYTSGGSAVPWYNGQHLAGKEDVVVVSLNYRLSIFGFPGSPSSAHANLGLLDQRLAVEWVRDNIAGFGGDPDRITLFGQSAGGGSVDHYSYAWTEDPVVKAFVPMSGTAAGFGLPGRAAARANWFNTTAACGCGDATADPDAVHACMLARPAVEIASNTSQSSAIADSASGLSFSPTVDETVVFSDYNARTPIAAPVLVGNTDFETGLFRLLAPKLPDAAWPLINDIAFDCPAAVRAAQSVRAGNPTWRYRWFGDFPNLVLSTVPNSGAWHSGDLPVLFNTTPTTLIPDTPAEEAMGSYFRGALAAFAKDPVNGLSDVYGWPRYASNGSTLIRLSYGNRTGPNLGIGNMYDQDCVGVPDVESPVGIVGGGGGGGGDGDPSAGRRIADAWMGGVIAVIAVATCLLLC